MIKYSKILAANAEGGNPQAQYELGYCYFNGIGVEENKPVAVDWYLKAANAGVCEAQLELADCYYRGIGVTSKWFSEAVRWYTRAAEQKSAYAYYKLGECYYYGANYDAMGVGFGENTMTKKATAYWKKAAELGYTEAEYYIGVCYYQGTDMPESVPKAEKLLLSAARKGHTRAQCELGIAYYYMPDKQRYAVEWLQRAANAGDKLACMHLGRCYFNGVGAEQDYAKALMYYRASGNEDEVEECIEELKARGMSIPSDTFTPPPPAPLDIEGKSAQQLYEDGRWHDEQGNLTLARLYYMAAAELGHIDALCRTGDLHWRNHSSIYGIRFKKEILSAAKENYIVAARADDTYATLMTGLCLKGLDETLEAIKYFEEAANCGSARAQTELGMCYLNGIGVAVNEKKGVEYLTRGADNGDSAAQHELGYMYLQGKHVQRDPATAAEFFEMGAEQGHALSCYDLGQCYEKGEGVVQNNARALELYKMALEGYGYISVPAVKKAIKRVK